jgi:RecB family endonuclease NucS
MGRVGIRLRHVRNGQYGAPTMRLLVARCEVLYTGRLTARLPEAVRLLMFKADGSFLVHDDAGGFRPLNWIRSVFRRAFPAYLRLDVKVSGALA